MQKAGQCTYRRAAQARLTRPHVCASTASGQLGYQHRQITAKQLQRCRDVSIVRQELKGRPSSRHVGCWAAEDTMIRCVSPNDEISIVVINATRLVQEACQRHKTSPTCSAAFGRTLMGALLLNTFSKESDERLQVRIEADGPACPIIAMADGESRVRGVIRGPQAEPPLKSNGKLNVSAVVGDGSVSVMRTNPKTMRPVTGTVPLQSGEIAEDLSFYLAQSEQRSAALGVGVLVDPSAAVQAAGGFYVELLPGADEKTTVLLEMAIEALPPPSQLIADGVSPLEICEIVLKDLGGAREVLRTTPTYGPCGRERMRTPVQLLGKEDCNDLLNEYGYIEVTCEFCQETYQFKRDEVQAWFAEV